ncbi:hypothetical protein YH65_01440 [Sulfurovum lithotrophicum]|uniref:Uncharacterized protein n=1 Tax=Sulfurovum lithotrophicum TaxID=206403 RepID=A0A7U4LZT9_9BACT|nr:hypothetical protein [Sulfurovum lithotrophicum]AKF24207.1 hypothetical protein YH65_01440 [Sulfurovum lithotrophicum]
MKLKHIALPVIGSMVIAGSTLYASGGQQGKLMNALQKVELQKNQKEQIEKFKEEQRKELQQGRAEIPKGRIFSKEGFNKDLYIKKGETAAKVRIEANANFIDKTFQILTKKQKVEWIKGMRK